MKSLVREKELFRAKAYDAWMQAYLVRFWNERQRAQREYVKELMEKQGRGKHEMDPKRASLA